MSLGCIHGYRVCPLNPSVRISLACLRHYVIHIQFQSPPGRIEMFFFTCLSGGGNFLIREDVVFVLVLKISSMLHVQADCSLNPSREGKWGYDNEIVSLSSKYNKNFRNLRFRNIAQLLKFGSVRT